MYFFNTFFTVPKPCLFMTSFCIKTHQLCNNVCSWYHSKSHFPEVHIYAEQDRLKPQKISTIPLSLWGNLGYLTWVRQSSRKNSATHSCQCAQYFHVCKQWHGCQCLGVLTCTHMLRHATAHGDCTDTVRESAPQAEMLTLGEISLAAPGTRTCISTMPGFSVGGSTSWAVPAPHLTLLAFNYMEKSSAACTGEVFHCTLKDVGVMWFL